MKIKTTLFSILLTPSILLWVPAIQSAERLPLSKNTSDCPPSKYAVEFGTDKTLFTAIAWLNWVGDRDKSLDFSQYDPIQKELSEELKSSTVLQPLYVKHRAAYDAFLKNASLYVKNGLFLSYSTYYGVSPQFRLADVEQLSDIDPYERQAISQMPSGELMASFYRAANLEQRWNKHYGPVHQRYIRQYQQIARRGIEKARCFLKVQPTAPVKVVVNAFDAFGTSGQTTFNEQERSFLIKLHVDKAYTTDESVFLTAAHEYTHVLMNEKLKPYRERFQERFDAAVELTGETKLQATLLEESFAQSVAYAMATRSQKEAQSYKNYRVYYDKNLLLYHFLQNRSVFETSGLPFDAYLPRFLAQYEPKAVAQDWLQAKKYYNPVPDSLIKLGFDTRAMGTAVKRHSSLLEPKIQRFVEQSGSLVVSQDPMTLWKHAFSQAQYFESQTAIQENVFYIYKNPLFVHLAQKIKLETLKETPFANADAWVREVFTTFDADVEAERWRRVHQRFQKEQ